MNTGRDKVKLTDSRVAALVRSVDKNDYVEWDDDLPGFGVRLRGDSKRWIVQYRVGPQDRRARHSVCVRIRD